ncbi:TPA: restriction endonuclease subunit M, partial [Escherichia coli]
MQTEAEILIDNNELICSTRIEWIVTVHQNALQQLTSL